MPDWLKKMVGQNKAAERSCGSCATVSVLNKEALHTVCVEARCPNKGHCFSKGDATFMILGSVCTRKCRFCAVTKGCPPPPADEKEALRIAETVKKFNLKYVVLTSPTRDDLPDGGAAHFAAVIGAVKKLNPGVGLEPLIPDFGGDKKALETVLAAAPEVLGHNMETASGLYQTVRIGADYERSLRLLEYSKVCAPRIFTKSGIMLGLGETEAEIEQTLKDLRSVNCDILTLGQYLAPSDRHNAVKRYPEPEEYERWKAFALSIGFKAVAAGPLVRSSYDAGDLYRVAKNG
jgi:lipoic acid synthetase